MNTTYIDFTEIGDYEDFYAQLKQKVKLPEHFGDNLDALSDHEMIFFVLAGKKYRFAEMHPCIPLHFIGFGLIWNTLA